MASGGISRKLFKQGSRNFTHFSGTTDITNLPDMTSTAASGRHLSKFETRPKMQDPAALFTLSLMQCQRHLQIARVKDIGSVVELSGVAFHLAAPYGGLLVVGLNLLDCAAL